MRPLVADRIDQKWFEMEAVRRRWLATAVWIPLRAVTHPCKAGDFGFSGFTEEFFGVGSVAVPLGAKFAAEQLGWDDIGISHQHGSYVNDGKYVPCDAYMADGGAFEGVHLVLEQRANRNETREWHLHQDLVVALGLKREDDSWVSPDEGYVEVARLSRGNDNYPSALEVRAEHLRDYLCARGWRST